MGLIAVKPSLLEKLVAWEAPTTRSRAAATVASSTTTDIPLGTPVYRAASAGPIVGKQAWSLIPTTFPTGDIYVGLTMADIPQEATSSEVDMAVLFADATVKVYGVNWGAMTDADKASFAYAAMKQGIHFFTPEEDNFADVFTNN